MLLRVPSEGAAGAGPAEHKQALSPPNTSQNSSKAMPKPLRLQSWLLHGAFPNLRPALESWGDSGTKYAEAKESRAFLQPI